MTSAIEAALEPLLRDLAAGGVPAPRVVPSSWQDGFQPSESAMLLADDGSGQGVWLDLSLPAGEALVHLADQVQDWAVEEQCRVGRPTNWPVCPAHPDNHPRQPALDGDQAVWTCPMGARTSTPIGALS